MVLTIEFWFYQLNLCRYGIRTGGVIRKERITQMYTIKCAFYDGFVAIVFRDCFSVNMKSVHNFRLKKKFFGNDFPETGLPKFHGPFFSIQLFSVTILRFGVWMMYFKFPFIAQTP